VGLGVEVFLETLEVVFAADNILKPCPQPPQNFGAWIEYMFLKPQ
jgi:hypothetical protein